MCDKVLFFGCLTNTFPVFIDFEGLFLKKKPVSIQKILFEWLKMKFDPKFWYVSSLDGGLALPTGQSFFIF